MKILYFGGQKSGKSSLAEAKALQVSKTKPVYIATYLDSYNDDEMKERITKHQSDRMDKFITVEEPYDIAGVIKEGNTYLVDCLSMWILNNLDKKEEDLLSQIRTISKIDSNIVFVLNEVTSGVIPMDKQSRKFVDLTGIVGQNIAAICDEVYEVKFGIEKKIKGDS